MLLPILCYVLSHRHHHWVLLGLFFSATTSQITARSREVLILLFSSVVTIRARSHARRFIAPDVDLVISGSGDDEVSLFQNEQLFPSEWRLVAYGVFLRTENVAVLGTRSFQPCAGAGALQRTLNKFHIAFSHASNLCVWFLCRFWLIFQVDTVELNCSDEGSRFFDRDYDSSKSHFHALAQR